MKKAKESLTLEKLKAWRDKAVAVAASNGNSTAIERINLDFVKKVKELEASKVEKAEVKVADKK